MNPQKVLILGAAGRDFHNFNTCFRTNSQYQVVAFTATQIPDISDRKYPASLAGAMYPEGIPIYPESDLEALIEQHEIDACYFSYSDVSYDYVMHLASRVNTAGANFVMVGLKDTQLISTKPLISVVASRTGAGKSQTARRVIEYLMEMGLKVVAIRHPMPYGNLAQQKVQRFARLEDLERHHCTIEEMEEYEPHVVRGNVIYAGADYEAILRAAEEDPDGCDVILWDGGNNDFSFYQADLTLTLMDPHRAGHELAYYPGEINLRLADVAIINKIDSAAPEAIQLLRDNIQRINPEAKVIEAASPLRVEDPTMLQGKRVLCVEDGPTLTHGGMKVGAATLAAMKWGAKELVDPRPFLVGKLKDTFATYPNIGPLLPAMGYGEQQVQDLEATIRATDCDVVLIGTPIDLRRIIKIDQDHTRVYYDLQEIGKPDLGDILKDFIP